MIRVQGLLYFLSLVLMSIICNSDALAQTRQDTLLAQDWKDIPGEKLFVASRSPSTIEELLNGGGPDAKVEAHLWLPEQSSGPVPVVVLFNCGNTMVKDKEGVHAEAFHKQGYAVMIVNSLAARAPGRDLDSEVFRFRYASMVDVFETLKLLAADPRIDSKRVAIMGWTNGGSAILGAAIETLRVKYVGPDLKYAAIIPISPYCGISTLGAHYDPTPILTFHGQKDDFMPLKPCQFLEQEAKARGANIDAVVYPGAYHNWEMQFPIHVDKTQNSLGECYLVTDLEQKALRLGNGTSLAPGAANARETVGQYAKTCKVQGITEGKDSSSRADEYERIKTFLQKAFTSAA
jgi:dienelactone hydrolase